MAIYTGGPLYEEVFPNTHLKLAVITYSVLILYKQLIWELLSLNLEGTIDT